MSRPLVLWLCVALVSSACVTAPAQDPEAHDPAGTLTTYLVLDPNNTDPMVSSSSGVAVVQMVYEGLLRLDPLSLRPAPAAAALPTISADGLTYRFALRQGLTYSDGSPLLAADFAYALSRLCDPQVGAHYGDFAPIAGCAEWSALDPVKETPQRIRAARAALFERGLRTIGDHALEISLTRPAAYLPSLLALWISAPVRERDVQRGGEHWWNDPRYYVGNGPFVLSDRVANDRLVFTANPKARVTPKLARWTVRIGEPGGIIPDIAKRPAEWAKMQARAVEAYRRDEVDVADVPAALLAEVRSDPVLNGQLAEIPQACTNWLRLDTTRPPFDDQKLRLALAMSIDRTELARVRGTGTRAAHSLIPPGLPGHDGEDPAQRFDPEAARRVLAQSAYGGGRLAPVDWPYQQIGQASTFEWLAAQWKAQLGIELRPRHALPEETAVLLRSPSTAPRIRYSAWCPDYPDQENWIGLFHSASRFSNFAGACDRRLCPGYASPKFDRLSEEAEVETDYAKRDGLYREASRLLSSDVAAIWLTYDGPVFELRKPWVRAVVDALGYRDAAAFYVVKR